MTFHVYIGYDERERDAYRVCVRSLQAHCPDVSIHPINRHLLGMLYQRPTSRREGVLWDDVSDAPMATDFSLARFWTPLLAPADWVVYCDCDFLWRASVAEVFALANLEYAVQCVKNGLVGTDGVKMDGQLQRFYPFKNWSSLMLFNVVESRRWLPLDYLNTAKGLSLHQFDWARSDVNVDTIAVGYIPEPWNALDGLSANGAEPKAVHFTSGIPSMPGYENARYADEWRAYATR